MCDYFKQQDHSPIRDIIQHNSIRLLILYFKQISVSSSKKESSHTNKEAIKVIDYIDNEQSSKKCMFGVVTFLINDDIGIYIG